MWSEWTWECPWSKLNLCRFGVAQMWIVSFNNVWFLVVCLFSIMQEGTDRVLEAVRVKLLQRKF